MTVLWAAVAAALISFLVGWAAVHLGARFGFIDPPDEIKTHTWTAVPLGGVGVVAGAVVGLSLAGGPAPALAISLLALLGLGVVDDRRPLDPRLRLGVEAVAAAVFATGIGGSVVMKVTAAAAVVVMVNAVNLVDGIDLLAGSVTVAGLGAMAVLAALNDGDAVVAVVGAGAVAGFLILNRPPARLFLGDGGAYSCGLLLVAAATQAGTNRNPWGLLAALTVVAFPIFDVAAAVIRRLRAGTPLFAGDRNHTYDLLAARLGVVPAVAVIVTSQVAFAALVITIYTLVGTGPAALAGGGGIALASLGAGRRVRPD